MTGLRIPGFTAENSINYLANSYVSKQYRNRSSVSKIIPYARIGGVGRQAEDSCDTSCCGMCTCCANKADATCCQWCGSNCPKQLAGQLII